MINNISTEALAQSFNNGKSDALGKDVLLLVNQYLAKSGGTQVTSDTIYTMLKLRELFDEPIDKVYKTYANIKLKLVNSLIKEEIATIDDPALAKVLWDLALNTGSFRTGVDFFDRLQTRLSELGKNRLFNLMVMRALTVNERYPYLAQLSESLSSRFPLQSQYFGRLHHMLEVRLDFYES